MDLKILLGLTLSLVVSTIYTAEVNPRLFCTPEFLLNPIIAPIAQPLIDAPFIALDLSLDTLNHNKYFLDGPTSNSWALTPEPGIPCDLTQADIMYYNYIAASAYCYIPDEDNLDCCYCDKFNQGVVHYKILHDRQYWTKAVILVDASRMEIILTFRGTIHPMNADFDFFIYPTQAVEGNEDIFVGSGFKALTLTLYTEAMEVLKELVPQYPGFKLVINGHSLGAAMASLTTFYGTYNQEFPQGTEILLVTFGQPRVGNKAYAGYMNEKVRMARVVNKNDVVPHYVYVDNKYPPPKYNIHHLQEVWITPENELKYCDLTNYEDGNCSVSLAPTYGIYNHVVYFDVDYTTCIIQSVLSNLVEPLMNFSIPNPPSPPNPFQK